MRIVPSIPAAIVTGAVWMPFFVVGLHYIEKRLKNQWLLIVWMLLGFFLPVVLATVDTRHFKWKWSKGSFLRPSTSPKDFKEFYIPTWIRIGVYFLSAVTAIVLLKVLGVNL